MEDIQSTGEHIGASVVTDDALASQNAGPLQLALDELNLAELLPFDDEALRILLAMGC